MQASMTAAELPLVLTVSDVQRMLGISRGTAYELAHRQDFPIVRIGRVIRVPRDAFLKWLEAQANVGVRKDVATATPLGDAGRHKSEHG